MFQHSNMFFFEVKLSAVFFSVLKLLESLVVYKMKKKKKVEENKQTKSPVLQLVSFITTHSIINSNSPGHKRLRTTFLYFGIQL